MKNIVFVIKSKNQTSLPETEITGFSVLEYSNKSKIIAALIVMVPCLFNFLTMLKAPKYSMVQMVLMDLIGLALLFLIFLLHEILHCQGYSAEETKFIVRSGFLMNTYCTEKLKRDKMIWVGLLPNLCITLPVAIISFFLRGINSPIVSVLSFLAILIIAGAYTDLYMVLTLSEHSKETIFCVSNGKMYKREQ